MLGPISVVNHSCVPNAVFKINLSKRGIVLLAASTSIKVGYEICVSYGSKYFEVNGVSTCQCPHEIMHGKTKQRSTGNSNKESSLFTEQSVPNLEKASEKLAPIVVETLSTFCSPNFIQDLMQSQQKDNTQSRRSQRRTETFESFWSQSSGDQNYYALP